MTIFQSRNNVKIFKKFFDRFSRLKNSQKNETYFLSSFRDRKLGIFIFHGIMQFILPSRDLIYQIYLLWHQLLKKRKQSDNFCLFLHVFFSVLSISPAAKSLLTRTWLASSGKNVITKNTWNTINTWNTNWSNDSAIPTNTQLQKQVKWIEMNSFHKGEWDVNVSRTCPSKNNSIIFVLFPCLYRLVEEYARPFSCSSVDLHHPYRIPDLVWVL